MNVLSGSKRLCKPRRGAKDARLVAVPRHRWFPVVSTPQRKLGMSTCGGVLANDIRS